MTPKVVIISQARMRSTRLPGKVMLEVGDRPLLAYHIERLKHAGSAHHVVIATTCEMCDDPIEALCTTMDVDCFRGSEHDVLGRFYEAAVAAEADAVVRVTADCPLIDPTVMEQVITTYLKNVTEVDYVSNVLERTYPRGMDTEIFSFEALERSHQEATLKADREHVNEYIIQRPEMFRLRNIKLDEDLSAHRWTVDDPDDFILISNIINALYPVQPNFSMQDILALLSRHPDWQTLNANVHQKLYGE